MFLANEAGWNHKLSTTPPLYVWQGVHLNCVYVRKYLEEPSGIILLLRVTPHTEGDSLNWWEKSSQRKLRLR